MKANRHTKGIGVPNDIMHAQALECQYHCSQTCPLDLWNCIFRHALLKEFRSIDSKALPSWGSSSSACSLLSFTPNHRKSPQKSSQISAGMISQCPSKLLLIYKTYFEIGTTSKISIPTLELWFSCLTKPLSTMYLKNRQWHQMCLWQLSGLKITL